MANTQAQLIRYPSSCDAIIGVRNGINGTVKDIDAAVFRYKISSRKTPLYNYAKEDFVTVANGKRLVTGIIGINYTLAGYFNALIAMSAGDTISNSATEIFNDTQLPTAQDVFNNTTNEVKEDEQYKKYDIVFSNTDNINLLVYVKGPIEGTYSYLEFSNTRFLDNEVAIDASTGKPLMIVYTFFANLNALEHLSN